MYDVVLVGGRVLDPAQGIDQRLDVAVEAGRIARLEASIDTREARRTGDVSDAVVCPGPIDLHAHVFDGVASNGVHPDPAGVRAGVTRVVDAGSAGSATFAAFPRQILLDGATDVLPSCTSATLVWQPTRTSLPQLPSIWMPRSG